MTNRMADHNNNNANRVIGLFPSMQTGRVKERAHYIIQGQSSAAFDTHHTTNSGFPHILLKVMGLFLNLIEKLACLCHRTKSFAYFYVCWEYVPFLIFELEQEYFAKMLFIFCTILKSLYFWVFFFVFLFINHLSNWWKCVTGQKVFVLSAQTFAKTEKFCSLK